jgi:hypothetical protein
MTKTNDDFEIQLRAYFEDDKESPLGLACGFTLAFLVLLAFLCAFLSLA